MEQVNEDELEIWEKIPGETDKAWTAFRLYRDLPPKDRSVVQAWMDYRELTGSPLEERPKKAPGYFCRWATQNDWTARVAAFDRFRDARAVAHAEIDHIAKLNSYRERLLGYAEVSTKNGIAAMKVIESSLSALSKEGGIIPPHLLPKFIQATAKLFETAADQEGKALAVDKLLEVLADGSIERLH